MPRRSGVCWEDAGEPRRDAFATTAGAEIYSPFARSDVYDAPDEPTRSPRESHLALIELELDRDSVTKLAYLASAREAPPFSAGAIAGERSESDSVTTYRTAPPVQASAPGWALDDELEDEDDHDSGAIAYRDEPRHRDEPRPLDLEAVRRDLFDDLPRHDEEPPPPLVPVTPAASLRPRLAELHRVMVERERAMSLVDRDEVFPPARPIPVPLSSRGAVLPYVPPAPPAPSSRHDLTPFDPSARGPYPDPSQIQLETVPAAWRTATNKQASSQLPLQAVAVVLTGITTFAMVVCAIVFLRAEDPPRRPAVAPTPVLVGSSAPVAPRTVVIAPDEPPAASPVSAEPTGTAPAKLTAPRQVAPSTPPTAPVAAAGKAAPRISAKGKTVEEILAELNEEQLKR